jgi:hypothetical protein
MTSGRVFAAKNRGEMVKRVKGERGKSFCKAIFSFSPLRLFPFFPLGNGREKALVADRVEWN